MHYDTDDTRITSIEDVVTPAELLEELPLSDETSGHIFATRQAIHRILTGEDDRLLVIAGPCSIHDPAAALEYGSRLLEPRGSLCDRLLVVMRVYFEKPRTTVGWKGLINDPGLDGSYQINKGLRLARQLLADIAELGLGAGTEFPEIEGDQEHQTDGEGGGEQGQGMKPGGKAPQEDGIDGPDKDRQQDQEIAVVDAQLFRRLKIAA